MLPPSASPHVDEPSSTPRCPVVHARSVQQQPLAFPLHPPTTKVTPWRWFYMLLGLASFALGGLGAVVPGLPTTVFLLVGSFFLTRSCPWLEEKLLATKLLRPYAEFVRSKDAMSVRSRVIALSCMWCSIIISLALLAASHKLEGTKGSIIFASIALAGVIGTITILLFRRTPRA